MLEQTIPHPPQLIALDATLISQPFDCLLPSQSENPAAQAPLQTPEPHVGEGMLLGEQTVPHPPQSVALDATLTSQPLACLFPSQSANPVAHAPLQIPKLHAGAGTWLLEQTMPHPPQSVALDATLTSQPSTRLLPLQSRNPAAQAPLHVPPAHVGAGMLLLEQTAPQAPQLAALPGT